ncbi:hypothetical protein OG439_46365 [Amycolatopsis sp. NBC_01307]|nr:hypothetical protein OG439_46365 [Amycolatopsis sp. NBC_01307]
MLDARDHLAERWALLDGLRRVAGFDVLADDYRTKSLGLLSPILPLRVDAVAVAVEVGAGVHLTLAGHPQVQNNAQGGLGCFTAYVPVEGGTGHPFITS